MKTVVIIQARLSSTRLPGKVLMDLGGRKVLSWCLRAAWAIEGVDEVVLATSDDTSDDAVASWCAQQGQRCIRGPLNDVLARYTLVARQTRADIVMRLTGDCPLLDPAVCADVIRLYHREGASYASNVGERTWPQGLDTEVFSAAALYQAEKEAKTQPEREHVTPYIRNHPEFFRAANLICPNPHLGRERWTLDTATDYAFLQKIAAQHTMDRPPAYTEILDILTRIPEPHNRNPAQ